MSFGPKKILNIKKKYVVFFHLKLMEWTSCLVLVLHLEYWYIRNQFLMSPMLLIHDTISCVPIHIATFLHVSDSENLRCISTIVLTNDNQGSRFLARAILIQLNGPLHFISIIKSVSYPSRDICAIYESKVQALKLGKCFHIYVIFTCPWPEIFLLKLNNLMNLHFVLATLDYEKNRARVWLPPLILETVSW